MVLEGETIRRVDKFKYSGLLVKKLVMWKERSRTRYRLVEKTGEVCSVLGDRKVYKTAVRPTLLYGKEAISVKKTKKI